MFRNELHCSVILQIVIFYRQMGYKTVICGTGYLALGKSRKGWQQLAGSHRRHPTSNYIDSQLRKCRLTRIARYYCSRDIMDYLFCAASNW